MMKYAMAMAGNSSSGIIEAASFELPVVNIGARQRGRIRTKNVVDADTDRDSIVKAIRYVRTPGFRESLAGLVNPYGDGRATGRILDVLRNVSMDRRLIVKRFCDLRLRPEVECISSS